MDLKVNTSEIAGIVSAPISKSAAHRLIIACALAGVYKLPHVINDDIAATVRCLNVIFANENTVGSDAPFADANAGESGSTLRFLLPIACALGSKVRFWGEGRLGSRPIKQLTDALNAHGAKITGDALPLNINGRLESGEYIIDASVSSQYITGLLFALPLLDGDSRIVLDGSIVSGSYINITLDVLKKFGIKIEREKSGFYIKGSQRYKVPDGVANSDTLKVEGDWSSAGFLLAMGVLCGDVEVKNLDLDSAQGDKVIVELLRRAGGRVEISNGSVTAKKSLLKAIEFDATDCPDIVPIMSVVLAAANGVSKISGVDRLKQKESDRLFAVRAMLSGFGIDTQYESDTLYICGGKLRGGELYGFNDHRIAMSSIVGAMCAEGESIVRGVECIKKSYPAFIHDAVALGGRCERI